MSSAAAQARDSCWEAGGADSPEPPALEDTTVSALASRLRVGWHTQRNAVEAEGTAHVHDSKLLAAVRGEGCPYVPGKRYEDWAVDDPAGQDPETVRRSVDDVMGGSASFWRASA